MTRDEAKKLFPILEEFANGGIIECRGDIVDRWTICTNLPLDTVRFEYRIKPKSREGWALPEIIFTDEEMKSLNKDYGDYIKVREVLDDE